MCIFFSAKYKSENHRNIEMGRNLWKLFSPTALLRADNKSRVLRAMILSASMDGDSTDCKSMGPCVLFDHSIHQIYSTTPLDK